MKKVTIVGIGIGKDTLTLEALEAIKNAEVLLGAQRMLDIALSLNKEGLIRVYPHYLPKDTADTIMADSAERFVVLVSGDVGFFSAAAGLVEALKGCDLRFIPGISTVNAFFAKLKLPWQDAAFVSAHGRETDIAGIVRRNQLAFCLTGNNTREIGKALAQAGFGKLKTYVGENLGTAAERVYDTSAESLVSFKCPSLTVLLFQNEAFDERTPAGLPDSRFSRFDGIPMTKSETRAVVMSKLNLSPASICWDIGAGSGSVTVEMALHAYRGHVYAVERNDQAIPLIRRNCAAFHIGNVSTVCGKAPGALKPLPAPNIVFIGGSGGEIGNIITAVWGKNPKARIVITAVTLETVSLSLAAFKDAGVEPEITQLNAARGKRAGELNLMEAQNPVTILCAGGERL